MVDSVFPGINPQVLLGHFQEDEKRIITKISREWYVTNGGGEIRLGPRSTYRYFLIKPTDFYREMFNLERELIVVFSPYVNFEPRTLDAIDAVARKYQSLRIEKVCSVIISKDPAIEPKLGDLLKAEPESQVVVPFSYEQLLGKTDSYFMRNRFKLHFYTRDLFAFEAPLKKDLYFFGRNELVHRIVNRQKSNENSGLFGLRKSGKTSVIFGVQRTLQRINCRSVFIDCQNPAFHRRRWNHALHYIIDELVRQHQPNTAFFSEEDKYTDEDAATLFEKDILAAYTQFDRCAILLIFDEIENITFNISPSEHWAKGLDFVYFWQVLRSLFQKHSNVFSYLVVGTNPMCIEAPTVQGKDNPIFNQFPFEYLKGFTVSQTSQMVRRLGRYMGLNFDDLIFGKLTEEFGGHPYLIRHVCSVINHICPSDRPVFVDKTTYENAKTIFTRDYANYIEMILDILRRFYKDEYSMLEYLAIGDTTTFNEFASMSPYYTNHLLGYGIIEKNRDRFAFKIESIRKYLDSKQKYKKLELTAGEMLAEISERRNDLEPKLRRIVRSQLIATYGKTKAKDHVLGIFGEPRKTKLGGSSYEDLFDPAIADIYFEDLRKLIIKHWTCFRNIFGLDEHELDSKMTGVNKYRNDAHAKKLTMEEMQHFRICISSLERQAEEFLG